MICKVCKAARLLGVPAAEAQGQFWKAQEGDRPTLESWKPLPSNGSEDMTVDTIVCV
jgi:hypothetical protein